MTYDTITQAFTGRAAVSVLCWCSIEFAIPRTLYEFFRRKNADVSQSFSLCCPLGHVFVPSGRSEAERLRDELAREQHWREQAQASNRDLSAQMTRVARRLAAHKGVLTKMKKRASDGRCPCCAHVFKDLRQHMQAQHPDFDPERGAEIIAARKDAAPATAEAQPPAREMSAREHDAIRCEEEGRRAFADGVPANPYARNGRYAYRHHAWNRGWTGAANVARADQGGTP